MQRIGTALAAGLAIWLGSTLVAEAQTPTITTTGPLCLVPGSSGTTYTGNVTLLAPSGFYHKLVVLKNNTQIYNMTCWVPNPQSVFMAYSRPVDLSCTTVNLGDIFEFQASIGVAGKWYPALLENFHFRVTVAFPTPPGTRVTRTNSTPKRTSALLVAADRERRRD
jgi:hypothetical protein